jgi:hypothetical protein
VARGIAQAGAALRLRGNAEDHVLTVGQMVVRKGRPLRCPALNLDLQERKAPNSVTVLSGVAATGLRRPRHGRQMREQGSEVR